MFFAETIIASVGPLCIYVTNTLRKYTNEKSLRVRVSTGAVEKNK